MKYGMAFVVSMYDVEQQEEHSILTMPGDYIRMNKWAEDNLPPTENDTVSSLRRNYATAWHALKRRGKLEAFGLPDELTLDVVDGMADRFTIYVEELTEDSIPLAGAPAK